MKTNSDFSAPTGATAPPPLPGGAPVLPRVLVAAGITAALIYTLYLLGVNYHRAARAKTALHTAYCIHCILHAYAQNHDQQFPDGATANEAYRQCFGAGYIDDEKVFHLDGCAWCWKGPDRLIGSPEDGYAQALTPGENHWAYVRGLTADQSDPSLPIVADGFIAGSPGRWSADPAQKGGAWRGDYAIVIRAGGNGKLYDLDSSLVVTDQRNGRNVNIFSAAYGTEPASVLNPE